MSEPPSSGSGLKRSDDKLKMVCWYLRELAVVLQLILQFGEAFRDTLALFGLFRLSCLGCSTVYIIDCSRLIVLASASLILSPLNKIPG